MTTEIKSPCIDICVMNEAGTFCLGCFRTIDDIARWSVSTDSMKIAIKAVANA